MSPIEGCFSFWYFQSSNVQLVSTKKKLSWTNTRSLKEKAREDLPHHAHSELGHYSTDAWRAPQGPKHYVSWTRGLIGGRVSILADKGKLLWLKKRSGELHSGPRQRQPLPKDAISPSPPKKGTQFFNTSVGKVLSLFSFPYDILTKCDGWDNHGVLVFLSQDFCRSIETQEMQPSAP